MSVAPRIKPRVVGVLPQETRLRIANERKARCILTRALGSPCRSGSFARVKMNLCLQNSASSETISQREEYAQHGLGRRPVATL